MMLLLHLPRYYSGSQLFANIDVSAFHVVIGNLIFKFITRLDKSENARIQGLMKIGECDPRFTSAIWRGIGTFQHSDNDYAIPCILFTFMYLLWITLCNCNWYWHCKPIFWNGAYRVL